MNHTGSRSYRGQAGAVGVMLVVWLAVVAAIGVVAIDAGSIALTKFGLADVASNAAVQAANAYHDSPNVGEACQAAATSIATDDPSARLGNKGCVVNAQTGVVTITVRKQAKTILAARFGFTKHFTKVTATASNGPTTL